METKTDVAVFADPGALADATAQTIVREAAAAVAARGRFLVALAGGATPRETYARLALPPRSEAMPWPRTFVFFGDERCVPPQHPESNYRMAHEMLLGKVAIPPSQVFRLRGESDDPEAAAAEYGRTLAEVFGTRRGEIPRFDLILLGMGLDGHTASLFPGSPALKEIFRPVAGVHAAAAAIPQRLTLTFPVLNAAACVVFIVAGAEKAKAVKAVLADGAMLPAGMVRPENGRLLWLVDRAAAALLKA
ncbi:MAG: 6-phosphogluconolactonase [Candidatus Rokubacteria bacterium 13_1_40CM_69_27]|nr:MAG: 6-phosphogluconolactonase [Candidatus Rokubacteria bacterium 13_1_40CM_69_27]OLC34308.1 MAG: 6-phosphogluconolactonase [Candidatus Rokubacteria bacterium 13_1_40CM_4_69_5]